MGRKGGIITGAVLLLAAGAPLAAQTRNLHIGPHVAYNFDVEKVAVGAQFSVPLFHRVEFYPSFDYYFVDEGSLWALNGDLKYRVFPDRPRWLYVGAGINVARASFGNASDTEAGFNLLGGVESLRGRIHPFAEARLTLGDGSSFQLAGGINITLGRH
jgi:hypothetical protein